MQLLRNTSERLVAGVSFGPGGRTLIAGGSGGFDHWDLSARSNRFVKSHAVKFFYGCIYDPQGRWVYVSDSRGGFRLLPLKGDGPLPVPGSPFVRHVTSFDLAAEGEHLVMSRGGAGSNRVECWQVLASGWFTPAWSTRDGELVDPGEPYYLNQADWFTNAVAISRDGQFVVVAEERKMISGTPAILILRNGKTGQSIAELGNSDGTFQVRLRFTPDGHSFYAWDRSLLEQWDLRTGRRTHRLTAPGRAYFQGLAVHPGGQFVVTVSGDGTARYWAAADLSPLRVLKWGIGKLHSVDLSQDGLLAAAGGDKGQIILWDVEP